MDLSDRRHYSRRWVERLRVVGLQRGQEQPEVHSQQQSSSGGPPGALTPGPSDSSYGYGYGFPSPPSGPGSPWSAPPTPGIDTPSSSFSYGLGGLTLKGASTNPTPKNALKTLLEVEAEEGGQQPETERQVHDVQEKKDGKMSISQVLQSPRTEEGDTGAISRPDAPKIALEA